MQSQLAIVAGERETLSTEKSGIQSQAETAQRALAELQRQLSQAATELANSTRQLHTVQAELRHAVRRAEESEKTQRDLQSDGTNLMKSLEEMRPKLGALTNEKFELSDRVDVLEGAVRKRDAVIADLEDSVQELTSIKEELTRRHHDLDSQRTREHTATQSDLSTIQSAYASLQQELEETQHGFQALEGERAAHLRSNSQQIAEIERLTASLRNTKQQMSTLQMEVDERRQAEAEQREFLDRAMTDIESLRADLIARDDEVEKLRQSLDGLSASAPPESLNVEMLSAYQQQHELELSSAQSQIRLLEARAFDSDAKAHSLEVHLHALEDELASLRTTPQTTSTHTFSPVTPSRPSSRANGDELRRATMARRTSNLVGPSRASLDYSLSAETRHKRKISLNMLKARMDSEMMAVSSSLSRSVSPALHASRMPLVTEVPTKHSHFLDESNIFWCHTCKGDLVIL